MNAKIPYITLLKNAFLKGFQQITKYRKSLQSEATFQPSNFTNSQPNFPYITMLKNAFVGLFFCVIIFGTKEAKAQETLTLQDAIKITLENNFDIKLVKNELEIRDNNATLGNAGLLPVAGATLTNNNAISNTSQTLSNGTEQSRNGAKNSSLNYGVFLNWTIFDGFGMFARYDQLKELEKYGEANMQQTILNRVAEVANTYYELVQQQQQLQAYDTAVDVSRFRRQIAQSRFEIGKAAKLEVLNAQVDFNTDTTNLLRQQEIYFNTQTQLNELMGRDVNIRFRVDSSVNIDSQLALDQLLAQATQQNPSLQLAQINRRIAELDLKQVRADKYPTITLNSGYNFTNSSSELGFATHSTGRGPYYGVTANINIFNGLTQWKNEENASILINNAQLQYEQQKQSISSQLSKAYQTYQTNLALAELEEANQKIAFQNLDITLEKFRLGSITTVEVRDAQLNYIDAQVRFSNAQYQAKLAEINLKALAGNMSF